MFRIVIPLPDPSSAGLAKTGNGSLTFRASALVSMTANGRGRDPVLGQDFLGPPLVQRQRKGERVGRVTGNPVELADGGDMAFAIRPIQAFGDVEDEIGPLRLQPFRERLVGLEPDHLTNRRQRSGDSLDRLGLIPLRVQIRLVQLRMQCTTSMTGILGLGGESFCSTGGGRRRLEVVG